jgi:classical protein kinase C
LKAEDKDRRILVEVWDWDRLSGNDFMGSLSFGISEIIKSPVEGWFKLLSEEEGEFYNVPVTDGIDTEVFRKQIRQKASVISIAKPKEPSRFDTEIPHNMSRKDIIRATDFNFLMVLGKGSFGKVRLSSIDRSSHFNSARSSGHTKLCRARLYNEGNPLVLFHFSR